MTIEEKEVSRSKGSSKGLKYTPRANHVSGAKSSQVTVSAGSALNQKNEKKERSLLEYKRFYFFSALVFPLLLLSDLVPRLTASVKERFAFITYLPLTFQIAALASLSIAGYFLNKVGKPYFRFAWNCFILPLITKKPNGLGSNEHQNRLEQFYQGQADIYDVTRRRLLRGRNTMLKLCAAQLRQIYPVQFATNYISGIFISKYYMKYKIMSLDTQEKVSHSNDQSYSSPPLSPSFFDNSEKRYAWIDVGGGTGENIERMNQFFPIQNFDRVYLVDITPSLCEVARKRFERLGWTNVKVLCMDAEKLEIPKEDGDLEIALITMSYSLSMIESFFGIIDRIQTVLSPNGIFGVSDFYVAHKRSNDHSRNMSWIMRWFWSIWFDIDNIYLHPCRRDYLEHKFSTVKSLSCRNPFMRPFIKIPYYVWVGAQKDTLLIDSFSLDGASNKPTENDSESVDSDGEENEEDGESNGVLVSDLPFNDVVFDSKSNHVTTDHVHGQGYRWRQPFDASLIPRFNTYIYAFAWEDPKVDLDFMNLKPTDKMLTITSGGCNILEYAVQVGPARIHAVDLNPCQNNMLELKMAGISTLQYQEFWRLFGEGSPTNFATLLDTHLSPALSPHAYQFWNQNSKFKNFHKTGCSGLAIRVFDFAISVLRLRGAVERMCNCDTIKEQVKIWREEVRPHILSKWLIRLLNNDRFLWGALGVPPAQMQMLLEEGSAHEYVVNTMDPIVEKTSLKDENYFYYLCLLSKYAPNNCPAYLSEHGFDLLKRNPERLDAIKIHTNTIISVLENEVSDGELDHIILMDHLDWFSNEDADAEISMTARKVAKGGKAYWRSAGKYPWYNEIFEKRGFRVYPLQIRDTGNMYIDRVNMYASFWAGEKL
ncbi:hypothetical protein HK096_000037 [Nowakowskiella sp. JEL0078]|nr:hypothetical protein HK096_000037 [Nowakowskiella sp. JEL0078]